MAPSPRKKNLGLANSRGGMYTRLCEERFDRMDSRFDRWIKNLDDEMRKMDEHVTRLEHGARQPRLAMEADGQANTKTRERTEGAATAVQAMRGDCFSVDRVEPGPNTNSTSFGVKVEPPTLPCRDDVVVESGAAASESCPPPMEMCSSTAAGGLVPTGEASRVSETTSNEPLLRFYETEEMNSEGDSTMEDSWTLTPSATYDSSSFWRLFAAPYCYRVVETKSRQNRIFDPGGSRGHLHACPFLRSWRALVCGEVSRAGAAEELQRFFRRRFAGSLKKWPVLRPCQ